MSSVAQAIPLPTSSGLFGPAGPVKVAGMTVAETGGSSSKTVVLRDGGATGTVLMALTVAAGLGSTSFTHELLTKGQLYAVVSGSGTLAGSVHVL